MKIGYIRVSTSDQNTDMQRDALERFGVERYFEEKISGAGNDRPALQEMLKVLRKGDYVVIWKLDRLGRSLKNLIELVNQIKESGAELIFLKENFNTSTSHGRLVFNIFASLAEYEREIIRERTLDGIYAAKQRGRVGGRKKGLSKTAVQKAELAKEMYLETDFEKKKTVDEICKVLGISKMTFYSYLDFMGVDRAKRN